MTKPLENHQNGQSKQHYRKTKSFKYYIFSDKKTLYKKDNDKRLYSIYLQTSMK